MLPGLWELGAHEFIELSTLLAEVSLDNFSGESLSLILSNEELSVWLSLLGYTLGSIILKYVSGEGINMSVLFVGLVVTWEDPIVSILPLSVVVVVSDEAVKAGLEAAEVLAELLDSSLLSEVLGTGAHERGLSIAIAVAAIAAALFSRLLIVIAITIT